MDERHVWKIAPIAKVLDAFAASWLAGVIARFEWWHSRSALIEECRRSPGGFYSMELVYENRPRGRTTLEWMADDYFLHAPFARSARRRLEEAVTWLRENAERVLETRPGVRILSVACGGARDAITAFRDVPYRERIDFIGVDLNEEAVTYARRKADEAGLTHFQFETGDVRGLDSRWTSEFDLILAMGICEYLPKEKLETLMAQLHRRLTPGGKLLYDVSCHNPSRDFFEEHLDWHITYRERDEILSFTCNSCFPRAEVLCECGNCLIMIECVKDD